MINEKMLDTFDVATDVPNYYNYASGYIKNLFEENSWTNYAVPYMWGTMGFIYNPELVTYEEASTWACSINDKFFNKTTIKGGKTQLNLHDGKNVIIDENDYAVGDVINLKVPEQEIKEVYPNINPYIDALVAGGFEGGLSGFTTNATDIWNKWGSFYKDVLTTEKHL